jgi:hypothetical protein
MLDFIDNDFIFPYELDEDSVEEIFKELVYWTIISIYERKLLFNTIYKVPFLFKMNRFYKWK